MIKIDIGDIIFHKDLKIVFYFLSSEIQDGYPKYKIYSFLDKKVIYYPVDYIQMRLNQGWHLQKSI